MLQCALAATHREQPCGHRDERSEEHTSELQSQSNLVCRLLLEKHRITPAILLNRLRFRQQRPMLSMIPSARPLFLPGQPTPLACGTEARCVRDLSWTRSASSAA